jgi:transcription antitermination factor NusG
VKAWYVFYIRHTRNLKVLKDILYDRDCKIWVPKYKYVTREGKNIKETLVPLFPGYVLVNIDYDDGICRAIEDAKIGYVLNSFQTEIQGREYRGRPIPLKNDEIERIKEIEKNYVEYSEDLLMKAGDLVVLTSGPLRGFKAKILNIQDDYANLEVFIFGRNSKVVAKLEDLDVQRDM